MIMEQKLYFSRPLIITKYDSFTWKVTKTKKRLTRFNQLLSQPGSPCIFQQNATFQRPVNNFTCSVQHIWCGRLRIFQFSGIYWKCLHTFTEWIHRLSIIDGTVDMVTINTTFLWRRRRLLLLNRNWFTRIWNTVTCFCCRFWFAFLLLVLMVVKDLKKSKETEEPPTPER